MLDNNFFKKPTLVKTRWVKKIWKTKIEMDGWNLRMLKVRGWRRRALDRRKWRNVLEVARAQTVLQ
jgi:hypothetical protein